MPKTKLPIKEVRFQQRWYPVKCRCHAKPPHNKSTWEDDQAIVRNEGIYPHPIVIGYRCTICRCYHWLSPDIPRSSPIYTDSNSGTLFASSFTGYHGFEDAG